MDVVELPLEAPQQSNDGLGGFNPWGLSPHHVVAVSHISLVFHPLAFILLCLSLAIDTITANWMPNARHVFNVLATRHCAFNRQA